jgi:hypothetical protein
MKAAEVENGHVRISFANADGVDQEVLADHVIGAPLFKVAVFSMSGFDGNILVGTAELDSDSSSPTYGRATLRTHFAIGTHALTASFAHVGRFLASTSAVQTLTVTGLRPTTTTLTESGNRGDCTLTAATVVGSGLVAPREERRLLISSTAALCWDPRPRG